MYTIIEKELFRWRRVRKNGREMAHCTKLLVIGQIVLSTMTTSVVMAAPTDGTITSGSGAINQVGTATNINQASQRLDINWRTFSTAANESINFFQPNAVAIAINRVTGGVPSELRGALNANGRVFVLNESGITFYGTSQVNVGALLATTAKDVTVDGDHFDFTGGGYGQVINNGNIHVSNGGFAVLAAPYVENTGTIQANLGQIQLASAKDFTVDLRGDGLINFTVSKQTLDAIASDGEKLGVDNSGTLQAQSGTINISANLASSIVQSMVNLGGVVDADAFGSGHNGGTVLVASVGDTNITGSIHADGGVDGNGGTVYTWADGTNHFAPEATITARGGDEGGDGGFVEVSGKDVIFRGTVNASAPKGEAGTLLIDPWALTIADGAGTDGSSTIYEQNIEATSQTTNVILTADHSITMNDLADNVLQGGSGNISMTVTQGGTISFVDKNDTIATTSGKIIMSAADGAEGAGTIDIGHLLTTGSHGDITLTAGSGGITTGNLTTGGAGISRPGKIDVETSNGGDISVGNVSIMADGGSCTKADLYMNAAGNLSAGSIFVQALGEASYGVDAEAKAKLYADGDITVTGDITVKAEADVTSYDAAYASAKLKVNAGVDLNITGNTLVSATATQTGSYGWDDAHAYATASLIAGNAVTINGNIDVNATALNEVLSANVAYAKASLEVRADGNGDGELNITGNHILVKADATRAAGSGYGSSYGYGSAYASADAHACISAAYNATINSDISVLANAANSGGGGYGGGYTDAYANATLNVSAGNNLSITGNILVKADATRMGVAGYASTDCWDCNYGGTYGSAEANANASISADNNVTINGPVTVQANAMNEGYGASGASADAELGISAHNDLSITGNILVKADATQTVGSGYGGGYASGSASASASAHLTAGNNVSITGPITVQANADNEAYGGTDAYAYSLLTAIAEEGDLNIAGNILVTADALRGSDTFSWDKYAEAGALALLTGGHNVTTVGTTTVTANAGTGYDGGEGRDGATAGAALVALAGIDGTGLLGYIDNVSQIVGESGYIATDGFPYDISFHSGNLHMTGDVTVTANAPSVYPDAVAGALAVFAAGNDVTILTDPITVRANATETGVGSCDGNCPSAQAAAGVVAAAGLADGGEGGNHGNLYITGDILAAANASGIYDSEAVAGVFLIAPDHVTDLYATTPPTASANSAFVQAPAHLAEYFFGEDPQEDPHAVVYIGNGNYIGEDNQGAGKVTIEPKSRGCGDECEVANALEAKRVEPIEPLPTGRDPLRIVENGLVLWQTGVGVTAPATGAIVTASMESAIAAGADPTALLPATAAGGVGLSAGLDAFSIGGTDYCDQVVSGFCLPSAGEKEKQP